MMDNSIPRPGQIVLFGSGEISPSGRQVYDWLFRRLAEPIRVAVMETPAGFEPNSAYVAGQVADFIRERLQNYNPQVSVVPARKRNTPFSPDEPAVLEPMWPANAIFLGPGSPTYAIRQLLDSLAWQVMLARHRAGAALVLASAATIAASTYALPVYEIYKVGEDLHWCWGLDLFGPYGLSLVFIPHWNNSDGGTVLDTSRCYMGQARFDALLALLPAQVTVVGLDEHTALVMDMAAGTCRVMGAGEVTLLTQAGQQHFSRNQTFPLAELGSFCLPEPDLGLLPEVWNRARTFGLPEPAAGAPEPTAQVKALVAEREAARARRDWASADLFRQQLAALGWRVLDTPTGPQLEFMMES